MNRRHFAHRLALAIGGLGLSPSLLASAVTQALRVNGQRLNTHIRELARFGRLATGGINRVAFGEADLEAREYVKGLMRAAGLEVAVDAAGNIIGRKEGRAGGGGRCATADAGLAH
jgi:N-carbamoyl-L-amino-acid hydrolase